MNSMIRALDSIANDPNIQGVVIAGAAPGSFCAGADINLIQAVTAKSEGERLAKLGQQVFAKVEALKAVTVAAIGGACAGGGCELALACNYRVLANTPDTRIGLPEVKLGIIPGFGGTQRLPRLVGVPAALDIILKGKLVSAEQAYDIGLADTLHQPLQSLGDAASLQTQLIDLASQIALGRRKVSRKTPSLQDRLLTWTGIGRAMVRKKVLPKVMRDSRGNYPALPAAIDSVLGGLEKGKDWGYQNEARMIGELVTSNESKSLVHVYQLTEECNKRWKGFRGHFDAARVAVIGAGTMGAGIAAALILADLSVTLVDPSPQARERAQKQIEGIVAKRKGAAVARNLGSRLEISEKIDEIAGCDVVIEAVIENLELKRKVMLDIVRLVSARAIIASNTSSLPISEFTQNLDNPQRIIGMHFFNPAEKMPLVEIVQIGQTDDRTIAMTAGLAAKLGKYPVVVHEVPGFLVNRVLSPYLLEAAYCLMEGFSITQIDSAALKFGMPMGPLRLVDEIGLDVAAKVAEIIGASYGERMQGPNPSAEMAKLGRLGKKSGLGFYRYGEQVDVADDAVRGLLKISAIKSGEELNLLGERLILPMVNEAVRALDEAVAGVPGREAAEQIDLGTVMGLGFAPFRGGVIHYAETLGAKALADKLQALQQKYGQRFAPAEGILRRASGSGQSFYAA